jgi:galactokinase
VALTLSFTEDQPAFNDLVLIAQEAEHRAGTPCGTMDQSASAAGGVILFEGATGEVRRLDPDLGDLVFVVADSGIERALGSSSYPVRVKESNEILRFARRVVRPDLAHLAELTFDEYQRLERNAPDADVPPMLLKRARHVVRETDRVRQGLRALEGGEWQRFGELMTESGKSSAIDYEISHPLVEELVREALAEDGVLGARMMGGGEGGTALILVERRAVAGLMERLDRTYYRRHNLGEARHRVHNFAFSDGATRRKVSN